MNCPCCGKEALWCSNEEIYGRRYGKSHMVYYCKDCNAYVGCHKNTRVSRGTMANAELRAKRIKVHDLIDPFWRNGNRGRREVYKMLSDAFGEQIHVGESDLKRCDEIIGVAKQIFPELTEAQ